MSQLSLFSADLTPPRCEDLGGLLAAHGQITRSAQGSRLSILLDQKWRARALVREFRVRDVTVAICTGPAELADLQAAPQTAPASPAPAPPTVPAALSVPAVLSVPASSASPSVTDQPSRAGIRPTAGIRPSAGPTATADPAAAPAGEQALLRSERTAGLDGLAATWTRGAVKAVPPTLRAEAGLLRCWVLAAGRPDEGGWFLGLDPRAPDTHERLASALAGAGLAGLMLGARAGGPGLRIVGHRRRIRLAELVGTPPPEAPPGMFPMLER